MNRIWFYIYIYILYNFPPLPHILGNKINTCCTCLTVYCKTWLTTGWKATVIQHRVVMNCVCLWIKELVVISIVKSTRCTNVSNLFYFELTLHLFRTVFPSIIRSSRLYIQQKAFVKQILLSASRQQYLYVQSWTPDDGRKDSPKQVECQFKIK